MKKIKTLQLQDLKIIIKSITDNSIIDELTEMLIVNPCKVNFPLQKIHLTQTPMPERVTRATPKSYFKRSVQACLLERSARHRLKPSVNEKIMHRTHLNLKIPASAPLFFKILTTELIGEK